MRKVIPAILLLFCFVQVLVSQTVNTRIQVEKDNISNFVCKIQVNIDDDSVVIGNAVCRIKFNPKAISFVGSDSSFNYFPTSNYTTSISQPNNTEISLNIADTSNSPVQLTSEYIDIATLNFNVNTQTQEKELKPITQQFFTLNSSKMWNVGSFSISEQGEEYIPILEYPNSNEIISTHSVAFYWGEIEGVSYYHLELSLDESFSQIIHSIQDISTTNILVKEIDKSTKYYWRVRSVTLGEYSHFSKTSCFSISDQGPTELISSSYNGQFVELNWQNNSVSAQYIVIDRKESGSQHYSSIDTINANRSSYIDPTIESEKGYVYRVSAINENTTSTFSDSTSIIMSLKKSEVENDLPKDFQLMQNYPNPFNPQTKINYSVKESSNIQITIYSLLGEKITSLVDKTQNAGNYDVTWNASNYPSGIYIYVMSAESNISNNTFQNVKKMILLK